MELIVTSRSGIEEGLVIRQKYIVISVRDPGIRRATIRKTAGLVAVLYLAFHDAEPSELMRLPDNIRLMTRRQARRIRAFVEQHWDAVGAIVCHCEQGMSRSPAIAAAIAQRWKLPTDAFLPWTQYNPYVFRLVREELTKSSS